MKWYPLSIAAILLVGYGMQEAKRRENVDAAPIRTSQLELVDRQGRVRAALKIVDDQPVFTLTDEQGRDRLEVFYKPDAAGVYVRDEQGQTRVGLAQFPHGGGLAMLGPQGAGSAVFVLMNQQARLAVYDAEHQLTDRWPAERDADQ